MKNKCYGCEKRHIGCHAECPDYAELRKKFDHVAEVRRKESEDMSAMADYRNHMWARRTKR